MQKIIPKKHTSSYGASGSPAFSMPQFATQSFRSYQESQQCYRLSFLITTIWIAATNTSSVFRQCGRLGVIVSHKAEVCLNRGKYDVLIPLVQKHKPKQKPSAASVVSYHCIGSCLKGSHSYRCWVGGLFRRASTMDLCCTMRTANWFCTLRGKTPAFLYVMDTMAELCGAVQCKRAASWSSDSPSEPWTITPVSNWENHKIIFQSCFQNTVCSVTDVLLQSLHDTLHSACCTCFQLLAGLLLNGTQARKQLREKGTKSVVWNNGKCLWVEGRNAAVKMLSALMYLRNKGRWAKSGLFVCHLCLITYPVTTLQIHWSDTQEFAWEGWSVL